MCRFIYREAALSEIELSLLVLLLLVQQYCSTLGHGPRVQLTVMVLFIVCMCARMHVCMYT